jgi:DNA (cytosine-5)-methyltransferase 1
MTPFPKVSMADALGWPKGMLVNTRGDRKTGGGNLFSADRPATTLTGNSTRTWYRTDLGSMDGRITSWQAGLLQGFEADYPWRGSRTSQFQRVADSVSPLMGAAVVGATLGLPWQEAVWRRLAACYGVQQPAHPRLRPCRDVAALSAGQMDLFEEVADVRA